MEAVGIRKPMVEAEPAAMNYRRRLHILNKNLAEVFGHPLVLNLGDPAAAEVHAAEALEASARMVQEDRASDRSLQDPLWANWTMGCVLLSTNPRRARVYLEAAHEIAVKAAGSDDALHLESEAISEEALGHALLATGESRRGLDLLRKAAFERISNEWPQKIDYRFALIRALNGLGDALPAPEASDIDRKAYVAAEAIPATARNVRELVRNRAASFRSARVQAEGPT